MSAKAALELLAPAAKSEVQQLRLRITVGRARVKILVPCPEDCLIEDVLAIVERQASAHAQLHSKKVRVAELQLPTGEGLLAHDRVSAVLRDNDAILARLEGEDVLFNADYSSSPSLPLHQCASAPSVAGLAPLGASRQDWNAQAVCDWLLHMMQAKEEAAAQATQAEAQAWSAAHIAKKNAMEATTHADRTEALMNVMMAALKSDDKKTTAAIIVAVKTFCRATVVNIFFVDKSKSLGEIYLTWMQGTHQYASPPSILKGCGLVGALGAGQYAHTNSNMPFLYFATKTLPGGESNVPCDITAHLAEPAVAALETQVRHRSASGRVRHETSAFLEEARLRTISSRTLMSLAEDVELDEDPELAFLVSQGTDDATLTKWAQMWSEDDSITGLHLEGGVNDVMCMGITNYGKLVGVLQVINRENDCEDGAADNFAKGDRLGLQTLCEQVSALVARTCANADFEQAMQHDEQLAEYSNDRSAWKVRRQSSAAQDLGPPAHPHHGAGGPTRPLSDWGLLPDVAELRGWGFATLDYDYSQLVGCTVKMFEERGFLREDCPFGTDVQTLQNFVAALFFGTYADVPYHNAWHGFSVCQCAYAILHPENSQEMAALADEDAFAVMIAALGHDAGHNGCNTAYHLSVALAGLDNADVLKIHGVPIGFLYNDKSPLENMHSQYTFMVAGNPASDIFCKARATGRFKAMRTAIVDQILATDMLFHNEKLDHLKRIEVDAGIDYQDENIKQFALQMILHSADLGNTAFPWAECLKWGRMCGVEMLSQLRREERNALPITNIGHRAFSADNLLQGQPEDGTFYAPNLGASQGGFLQFVCVPMFEVLARHFGYFQSVAERCKANLEEWTKVGKQAAQLPPPTANELVAMGHFRDLVLG